VRERGEGGGEGLRRAGEALLRQSVWRRVLGGGARLLCLTGEIPFSGPSSPLSGISVESVRPAASCQRKEKKRR